MFSSDGPTVRGTLPLASAERIDLTFYPLETRRAPWKRARLGRSRVGLGGATLALLNMLLVRSYNRFILSAWPEGDHLPAREAAPRQEEGKGAARTSGEDARYANRHAFWQ
jgi:hypothetical protein